MSNDGKKVVWVPGAGFSKSLGGPLLPDLLSHRGQAHVHHAEEFLSDAASGLGE